MVVAQLEERSLLTPEVRGLNPDISKILSTNCTIKNRKDENKEKTGNGPSLKKCLESQDIKRWLTARPPGPKY